MHLLIAIPAYGGQVSTETMVSVFRLQAALIERGIPSRLKCLDHYNIAESRNIFAATLLQSPQTHILFIDNDIGFDEPTIFRMIDRSTPVIACDCPKRTLAKQTTAIFENGKPVSAGTGLCLIDKAAFNMLIETNTLRIDASPRRRFGVRQIYGFFDQMQDGGKLLSEDRSFFRRWRECGGTIDVLQDEPIRHIGRHAFA